jgi:hypothetical protein
VPNLPRAHEVLCVGLFVCVRSLCSERTQERTHTCTRCTGFDRQGVYVCMYVCMNEYTRAQGSTAAGKLGEPNPFSGAQA